MSGRGLMPRRLSLEGRSAFGPECQDTYSALHRKKSPEDFTPASTVRGPPSPLSHTRARPRHDEIHIVRCGCGGRKIPPGKLYRAARRGRVLSENTHRAHKDERTMDTPRIERSDEGTSMRGNKVRVPRTRPIPLTHISLTHRYTPTSRYGTLGAGNIVSVGLREEKSSLPIPALAQGAESAPGDGVAVIVDAPFTPVNPAAVRMGLHLGLARIWCCRTFPKSALSPPPLLRSRLPPLRTPYAVSSEDSPSPSLSLPDALVPLPITFCISHRFYDGVTCRNRCTSQTPAIDGSSVPAHVCRQMYPLSPIPCAD
ncbi:hypothetical protein B0H16DRAFT_1743674 [Mycena metata]|uniref:Uncharacterized protein n=1 Tax=Mycena metata TaxID=1033252 RepID=A0AAD7H5S7_9AGAR|nr:hypothetical protein B0H16DRAFT_1743674 [Mycena metata]